jgi:hypothetical protein
VCQRSYPESKSADQDGTPCRRETKGLLLRRDFNASAIAHIGKEANQLDQRETGELTADAVAARLLDYRDPSADTWRNRDLPRLKQIPLNEIVAIAGLSERRLRNIYAGRATPRQTTKERLRNVLTDPLPGT